MIKMTKRARGSPHGHDAYWYEAGATYTTGSDPPMTTSLAATFKAEGWAVGAKDLGAAPEDKMLDGPASNKAPGESLFVKRRRGPKPRGRPRKS